MINFVTTAVKEQNPPLPPPKKRQLQGKTPEQGHSVGLLIKLGVFAGFKFHLKFTAEAM